MKYLYFTMRLRFLEQLFFIQVLVGSFIAVASSTEMNTFLAVHFLPDWTNSVYKAQQLGQPSSILCASICIHNEECSFFFLNSGKCNLGKLTLTTSGSAIQYAPEKILINEGESFLLLS